MVLLLRSNFPAYSTTLNVALVPGDAIRFRSRGTRSGHARLWSSFVNYVEGCFRSPAEAVEAGRAHNLPNACLAGLGA